MDELKYLDLRRTGEAQIPEGLEERLSMKIGLWAEKETKSILLAEQRKTPEKGLKTRFSIKRIVALAACITAIIGITGIASITGKEDIAHKDTFSNPEEARAEAERAIYLLVYNLGKSMEHLEKATEITTNTRNTLNSTLKSLE